MLLVEDNDLNMEIAEYYLDAAGMNAHPSKPLDMRALIDAVKRYGR